MLSTSVADTRTSAKGSEYCALVDEADTQVPAEFFTSTVTTGASFTAVTVIDTVAMFESAVPSLAW